MISRYLNLSKSSNPVIHCRKFIDFSNISESQESASVVILEHESNASLKAQASRPPVNAKILGGAWRISLMVKWISGRLPRARYSLLTILMSTALISLVIDIYNHQRVKANYREFIAERKVQTTQQKAQHIADQLELAKEGSRDRELRIQETLRAEFPATSSYLMASSETSVKGSDGRFIVAHYAILSSGFNRTSSGPINSRQIKYIPELAKASEILQSPNQKYIPDRGNGYIYKIRGNQFHFISIPVSADGKGFSVWSITNLDKAAAKLYGTSILALWSKMLWTVIGKGLILLIISMSMDQIKKFIETGVFGNLAFTVPWDFVVLNTAIRESRLSLADTESDLAEKVKELTKARDLAESKQKESDDLQSVIRHELKSEVAGIQKLNELFLTKIQRAGIDIPQEDLKLLKSASTKSDQACKFLDDIRSITDIAKVNPEPISQWSLFELSRVNFLDANVTWQKVEGVKVLADAQSVCISVINNIVKNALTYGPANGKVEVKFDYKDDMGIVRIVDQGPGIPKEYQDAVFEFGIDSRLDPEKEGTGVGLYLAKKVVEAHGQKIGVANNKNGKGCTFFFTLKVV